MRLALALLLASVLAAPAFAQEPVLRTLTPSIVKVGKWAEGVAFDGNSLWVAESGQRSIAQIARDGSVQRHANVGRLPVNMAALPGGRIFALVKTDQVVWRHLPREAGGRPLKWLPDYPQAIAAEGSALWVLTELGRVYRIDATTGSDKSTESLGEHAMAIAAAHGKVWVGHAGEPRLSVIDPQSLAAERIGVDGAELWALTANRSGLFAGGRIKGSKANGLIVSIDPQSRRETNRLRIDEFTEVMTADDETLVAVGTEGTIWIIAAKDFTLQAKIKLSVGTYSPQSALIHDGKLVVVAQQYQGENGAVFTLDDWRARP